MIQQVFVLAKPTVYIFTCGNSGFNISYVVVRCLYKSAQQQSEWYNICHCFSSETPIALQPNPKETDWSHPAFDVLRNIYRSIKLFASCNREKPVISCSVSVGSLIILESILSTIFFLIKQNFVLLTYRDYDIQTDRVMPKYVTVKRYKDEFMLGLEK